MRGPVSADLDLSLADAELIGEDQDDLAGYSVAGVGDVDADGYDDRLLGAYQDDDAGYDAGAAYLVYGPVAGDLDLSLADAKLTAENANDEAGRVVAAAGDVNADGYADVLVGARWSSAGGVESGAVYLVTGPVAGDLGLLDAGARVVGAPYEPIGERAVASAGDANGDGHPDLIIGASRYTTGGDVTGAAYLVAGPVSGDMSLSAAEARLEDAGDDAGTSVAFAGDVDLDGYIDVLVGADGDDVHGGSSGATYLRLGGPGA